MRLIMFLIRIALSALLACTVVAGQQNGEAMVSLSDGKTQNHVSSDILTGELMAVKFIDANGQPVLVQYTHVGPPKILPIAAADSYPEGSSINLICTVSGGQRQGLELEWHFNGEDLLTGQKYKIIKRELDNVAINTDETDISILRIKNATHTNSGTYTCNANNPLGRDSTSVKIVINAEPRWTKIPQDLEIGLNQKVDLECDAVGSPQPTIEWFKLSSSPAMNATTSIARGKSLKISRAHHGDSGLYECLVKNGIHKELRKIIQIKVKDIFIMSSNDSNLETFDFTEANVERLKNKYSNEMRDDPNNPIKICMKLVFDAVIEKDHVRRSGIAYELSKFLIKPDGIINLFLALIDFDTSSQKVTTHNQRFVAVSNIIACLPKICIPYRDYCDNIFKQLHPLLSSDNVQYSNLASIIVKSLLDSPHAKGKNVIGIVIEPLFYSLEPSKNMTTTLKPHESILAVHNLIVNHLRIDLFVDVFPNLFYSLMALNDTPSNLKTILKTCLKAIFNGLEPGVACCLLEKTIFHSRYLRKHLAKSADETEISIKIENHDNLEVDSIEDNEIITSILLHILEKSKESHILEFFFKFQEAMWFSRDDASRQLSAAFIEPMLCQSIEEESSKLDLLSIIATNRGKSLELISRTLLNYVGFLRCGERANSTALEKLITQSIGSCFSILEVLSVTLSDKTDIKFMQEKCLPILMEIKSLMMKNGQEDKEVYNNLLSLIKSLNDGLRDDSESSESSSETNQSELEYQGITKDLNDKLVPVRVHALVKLRQMIMSNDSYIVTRIPKIYSLVESSLNDDEPYVFLACINLLAEMSVRNTDEMLPKLIDLYTSSDHNIQVRINIGEVLVRLTRQMNQTAPHYANQVMNMFYSGCKDSEELMRMSSLANIGEICRHLGDALGKYIVEILVLIEYIMSNDSLNVKCAAINLLRTTLMGLDRFTIESIQKEMKSMYNLMKKLKYQTLDDKFCLQVDLALDEIDRLAREMLFEFREQEINGTQSLVKNIKVLSLLD